MRYSALRRIAAGKHCFDAVEDIKGCVISPRCPHKKLSPIVDLLLNERFCFASAVGIIVRLLGRLAAAGPVRGYCVNRQTHVVMTRRLFVQIFMLLFHFVISASVKTGTVI